MAGQTPTIRQIARVLGMSPSTVSQALNNKGSLRAKTRERVISKAKEMGYYSASDPFGIDRALTGRPIWFWPSGMRELPPGFELLGFPAQVWQGAQNVFKPYRTVLKVVVEDDLRRGLPEDVAGTIVTGGYVSEAMAEVLRSSDRPTVIVGAHVGAETGACCVECDVTEGIRMAVEHLHSLGHRQIGFINGPLAWRSSNQKLTGFVRGAFDYSVPCQYVTSVDNPWDDAGVTQTIRALLTADWKDVTALICAYEAIGTAAMTAANSLDMAVPQH